MKTLLWILMISIWYKEANAQKTNPILPDYGKVQYAGSIGFLSAGFGYQFCKNKINTEILYGYVPAIHGGPLDILTLRLVYHPVTFKITQSVLFTPITLSGFVSYHIGDNFYVLLPSNYYKDYYYWSSAIRYHAGVGSMLAYKNKQSRHGFALYYELNTNDLYVKSLRANSTLRLEDILSLGMGVKFY